MRCVCRSAANCGAATVHGVPRRDLVQGLRVGLEKGDLQVGAKLRMREALLAELRDLRTRGSRGRDDLSFCFAAWLDGLRLSGGAGYEGCFGAFRVS